MLWCDKLVSGVQSENFMHNLMVLNIQNVLKGLGSQGVLLNQNNAFHTAIVKFE
jgi:hypothetical protein